MKIEQTTPSKILHTWEIANFKLSKKHRQEFLTHKMTQKLCEYKMAEIRIAILIGKKVYLPEILEFIIKENSKRKGVSSEKPIIHKKRAQSQNYRSLTQLRATESTYTGLWAGNFSEILKDTSSYNCSVCQGPVIGLRCKCAIAA